MALLTIDYLQAALGGVSFDDAEAARAQFYIDAVSSWIESYTNAGFGTTTGFTERLRSDSYGCIVISKHPVQNVSAVHSYDGNFDLVSGTSYFWDGLQTLNGLRSRAVYDVTYDYGFEPAPIAVQIVATKAVIRGLQSGPTSLKALTVGDITEQYGDMLDFSDADMMVLDNYNETEGTIRLSAAIDSQPPYPGFGDVLNGPDYWYDWDA